MELLDIIKPGIINKIMFVSENFDYKERWGHSTYEPMCNFILRKYQPEIFSFFDNIQKDNQNKIYKICLKQHKIIRYIQKCFIKKDKKRISLIKSYLTKRPTFTRFLKNNRYKFINKILYKKRIKLLISNSFYYNNKIDGKNLLFWIDFSYKQDIFFKKYDNKQMFRVYLVSKDQKIYFKLSQEWSYSF